MSVLETRPAPGMKFYTIVWAGLLLIVAAEVILTAEHLATTTLFAILLVFAVIEAAIGLLYFMHLRFERRLFWTLIPALVFVLVLMNHFFPDAFRLMHQRLPSP